MYVIIHTFLFLHINKHLIWGAHFLFLPTSPGLGFRVVWDTEKPKRPAGRPRVVNGSSPVDGDTASPTKAVLGVWQKMWNIGEMKKTL